MRICLTSAEVAPFAKTGGLADVAAALPRALAGAGHDVKLVMPLYARIKAGTWPITPHPTLQDIPIVLGGRRFFFSVSTTPLPKSDVQVHLVRCPELYDREGIYTQDEDEPLRFAFLSLATLHICQWLRWSPDVVHANDWHTALLPLYLKQRFGWDRLFATTRTVLTIHNVAYQGVFGAEKLADLGLDDLRALLWQDDLRENRLNCLKTGLVWADALTTVSPTYAREIQTSEMGMGLDEVLRSRSDHLFGILNGVDSGEWDPEIDPRLPARYSARDLRGKARCKEALLQRFNLPVDLAHPVIGAVSRLTAQKGFDLLPDLLPVFLKQDDARFIVLGSGEERYESFFQWLRDTYPHRVGFYRGYSEDLAHLIEAGSDMFLMPSRFEPCGLNQMYSLRYGTVPVVRRTGGLADTVEPYDASTGSGTGFLFDEFTTDALYDALRQALGIYRNAPAWDRLRRAGMARDFSWERQCREYVRLYERLVPR